MQRVDDSGGHGAGGRDKGLSGDLTAEHPLVGVVRTLPAKQVLLNSLYLKQTSELTLVPHHSSEHREGPPRVPSHGDGAAVREDGTCRTTFVQLRRLSGWTPLVQPDSSPAV